MTFRSAAPLLPGALILILAALAWAVPARGQSAITLGMGEAADAATGVATGNSLSLGFTTYAGPGGVALGLGLPADSAAGTRWGSGAAWADWPAIASGVGLTTSLTAFGYQDAVLQSDGAALAVRGEMYRDMAAGPIQLRVRGGGRAGTLSAESVAVRRGLLGVGGDATLSSANSVLRVSADLWAAPEAVYPAVAGTGAVAWRGVVLHGRIDRWLHPDLPETGWSVGVEVPVAGRLSLVAQAVRPATDILFSSSPQHSWSVGGRYSFGAPPQSDLAVPAFSEPGEAVVMEVVVPAESEPVHVAGSFSDWEPLAMTPRDGRWVLELRLEPGVYEYAFVDADGRWFVPEGTPGRKPDGFGGFVGMVVVR